VKLESAASPKTVRNLLGLLQGHILAGCEQWQEDCAANYWAPWNWKRSFSLAAEVGLGTERRGARHIVAALYRYAKTKHVSAGFRLENVSMAWQPKR